MDLAYYADSDTLTLILQPGAEVAQTETNVAGIMIDRDPAGAIVATRVPGASVRFDRETLERLDVGRLLSMAQVAKETGLNATSLRVELQHGRLAGEKRGREWVVTRGELTRYLDRRASERQPPRRNGRRAGAR